MVGWLLYGFVATNSGIRTGGAIVAGQAHAALRNLDVPVGAGSASVQPCGNSVHVRVMRLPEECSEAQNAQITVEVMLANAGNGSDTSRTPVLGFPLNNPIYSRSVWRECIASLKSTGFARLRS